MKRKISKTVSKCNYSKNNSPFDDELLNRNTIPNNNTMDNRSPNNSFNNSLKNKCPSNKYSIDNFLTNNFSIENFQSTENFITKDYPNENLKFIDQNKKILIYQTNCLELMDKLLEKYPQNGLFDMIFADPPYFLSNNGITCHSGKMVSVNKGNWDKSKNILEIHNFNYEWISRCQKLLKPNGTIWISGTHHVIFSIGFILQTLNMKILNTITWEKPNPPPNLSCRYFTHSSEIIIWAAKNKNSKHIFNYQEMKKENNGKQMKSTWIIPPPTKNEKILGKHPTQKPLKLLERIITASTHKHQLIFDPFCGSGTTAIAAIKLNRYFIGCDIDPTYINLTIKRIKLNT